MHLAFIGIGGIGGAELMVIAVIAVILFGSKLPEVARSVGQSYTQFRNGLNDIQSSIKHEIDRELDEVKRIPCLLYTSPSPRDLSTSRMPSSA